MNQINKLITTILILSTAALAARELEFYYKGSKVTPFLTVYVTGEVAKPGTVTLPQGARRIHALESCGGVSSQADLSTVDPAKPLVDGETLTVSPKLQKPGPAVQTPSKAASLSARSELAPESSRAASKERKSIAKVEINSASVQEFEQVPGIGPALAQRIVDARNLRPSGSFNSIEDLTTIRGIKGKTMARLSPYLELEGP